MTWLATLRMDEHLARHQADDLVGRHTRIEQPIHRIAGACSVESLREVIGSFPACRAQARLKSNRCDRFSLRTRPDQLSRSSEEHRAFERGLVVGRRFLEAEFAVKLHGDAHRRQGIEQELAHSRSLPALIAASASGRPDRRPGASGST